MDPYFFYGSGSGSSIFDDADPDPDPSQEYYLQNKSIYMFFYLIFLFNLFFLFNCAADMILERPESSPLAIFILNFYLKNQK